jgi:hypothetical protein
MQILPLVRTQHEGGWVNDNLVVGSGRFATGKGPSATNWTDGWGWSQYGSGSEQKTPSCQEEKLQSSIL